jgi:hypothetical protein
MINHWMSRRALSSGTHFCKQFIRIGQSVAGNIQSSKSPFATSTSDDKAARDIFPVPKELHSAHISSFTQYSQIYKESIEQTDVFWSKVSSNSFL